MEIDRYTICIALIDYISYSFPETVEEIIDFLNELYEKNESQKVKE